MRTRLKDVAELAGVSIKTVSNVVNGSAQVRAHTRERVERALAELGYRPNLSARSLRAVRTGVVALAVPELDIPHFAELARHVVAAAAERGWTVLIDQTSGSRLQERAVLSGHLRELIDGVVFSPLALTAGDLAARGDSTPMVLLTERAGSSELVADHVVVDNAAAAREAVGHLVRAGRGRIAVIGSRRAAMGVTARLRLSGYRQALRRAGISVDTDLVRWVPACRREDGTTAMAFLLELDEPPDAVFCFDDLLALGALRTLLWQGVRVPDDVALVGFGDLEDGRYTTPTLTTVRPCKSQIARLALELLASRLAGDRATSPRVLCARHDLVVRESTTVS